VTQERTSSYGTVALVAAKAFGENVRLLVWPWPLYLDRAFTLPESAAEPAVLAGLLVFAVFVVAAFWSARRAPPVAFALAWYGLNLLPVSNVVPLSYWYVAERFLYVPSVGFALLAGVAWQAAGRRAATAAVVAILTAYAALTVTQNLVWKDARALYSHTLAHNPGSYRAHHGIGLVLEREGDRAGAEGSYREAIRRHPPYAEPRYALATLLLDEGRLDEAVEIARSFSALEPEDPRPFVVIGNAEMERERWPEAISAYREAVGRDPTDPDALFNLGNALAAAGEDDEALRVLDDAIARGGGEEAVELRDAVRARLR
jgi:tetratricopeptide (TPR) repeat protein